MGSVSRSGRVKRLGSRGKHSERERERETARARAIQRYGESPEFMSLCGVYTYVQTPLITPHTYTHKNVQTDTDRERERERERLRQDRLG